MAGRVKNYASINSVEYAVSDWRTIEQGRALKHEWTEGWTDGMGDYTLRGRKRYLDARHMDASRSPMIRLPPTLTSTAATNMNTDLPVYGFLARSPNGVECAYILNGRYGYKIQVSDKDLDETIDFGANAQAGRPALFEGNYFVPVGDSVDYWKLTVSGVAEPGNGSDTGWSQPAAGEKALAFAVGMKEGTAQLARVHTTNLIDLSADGTNWSGHDWEIGDSSVSAIDMHYWRGEWAVVKEDGVWVFDEHGNSWYLEQYTGRTENSDAPNDGANSFAHGQYFYWAHRTGLWRFYGDRGTPVGFESDPDWDSPFSDVISATSHWYSVAAFGRWLYGGFGDALFFGYIRDDGRITWHGSLYETASGSTPLRCLITESDSANTFVLWICEDGLIKTMQLERDGSIRNRQTGATRGETSQSAWFRLPVIDFDESSREKQLRTFWVHTQGTWTKCELNLSVYRNWGTGYEDVGAKIEASGQTERAWTAGTNDLAYVVQGMLRLTTDADYVTTDDPRIMSCGIEAATPNIIRAILPLTVENIKTGQTPSTVHQALRNLLNGPRVAIIEPDLGGKHDTFNGRIIGYSEVAITSDSPAGRGWEVTLDIARYDYGS